MTRDEKIKACIPIMETKHKWVINEKHEKFMSDFLSALHEAERANNNGYHDSHSEYGQDEKPAERTQEAYQEGINEAKRVLGMKEDD